MDQPQPQFVQPQFVMMPAARHNGLGLFGFLVAMVGLFVPTGVVALLGLVLSLAAIGRAPRGFATGGVILGLLGTVFWLVVMAVAVVVALVAALAGAVAMAGAFLLTQPEVVELTSDMVNVAIAAQEYESEHDEMPAELGALGLGVATVTDPWGRAYRFELIEADPGFDVVSGGADGEFGTDDDVRLTRLDRLWESAFEGFEERMEELGHRLEHMEGRYRDGQGWQVCPTGESRYERMARRELRRRGDGDD